MATSGESEALTTQDMHDMMRTMFSKLEDLGSQINRLRPNPEKEEERRKLDNIKLSSKGNQKQLDFCISVRDRMDKALDNLENNENNINEAKEELIEGKKYIDKRIKLIRFADRETWMAAAEYDSDELADDSEDEKHMNRSVRSAEIKSNKAKRKRFNHKQQQGQANFIPTSQNVRSPVMPYPTPVARPAAPKTCFSCGRIGHISRFCFARFGNSNGSSVPIPQNQQQMSG